MRRLRADRTAVTPALAVVLLVAVVLVVGGAVTSAFFQTVDRTPEPAPTADLTVEVRRAADGVPLNDAVVLTHEGGDQLDRRHLEVVVGDDVVFNETDDSESNGNTVQGLRVEVDDDEWNDLNKPCRLSPPATCGGPPGDADGSDASVTHEWETVVRAGQTLVIQERNDPRSYDTIRPGESVTVIYRGDEMSVVLARTTVPG
jgi:FlaG/FlaF family flagellin (archaellin)